MNIKSATFVPPRGNFDSKIIIVGDNPSAHEIKKNPRQPFSSLEGKELLTALNANGIAREDCYFTYAIKDIDYPLSNYINFTKRNNIPVANCSDRFYEYAELLKEELECLSGNVIMPLGDAALYMLAERIGITKWRGSIIESTLAVGRKLVPSINPNTIIAPKRIYNNKYLLMTDIAKASEESAFPEILHHPSRILIRPTFEEAVTFLVICKDRGLKGSIISLDIEVIGEIDCIAFSYDEHNAASIPFNRGRQGDYYTLNQEITLWKQIAEIIEHPDISLCGQNIIFDLQFIHKKLNIVPKGNLYCTMVAQKLLYPDFPIGLDFITSIYTRLPYYKADGKKWMKMQAGTLDNWWEYNARDALVCSIAIKKQLEDIKELNNDEVYEQKMQLHYPLMFMSYKGINIDVAGIQQEREETLKKIEQIEEEINEKVGYEINTNSPKQLQEYFYDTLKIKPYLKRTPKGWVPTVDETALKRIARKGVEVANLMLKIRKLSKRAGNYLDVTKISPDARVRCQYKPHGADTGRLASSSDIFDEGMNQQNWPHDLLKYLTPDSGHIFYSFDLSQIENRIVANIGRVMAMIEAFENGIDVHKLTAALFFNKRIEEISDEVGSSTIGDGTKSERHWGKAGNHSLNYDFGYKAFALKYEITEKAAKWIINRYHQVYPEVRGVFHAHVKTQLAKDRTLTNLMGRKRRFLGEWGDLLFRDAYAHIPQSTVADKIDKHALNYIYGNQTTFSEVSLMIQIHDSVGFQIPLSVPLKHHADILLKIHSSMSTPLCWKDREFDVPTDLTMGFNLNKQDCIDIKDKNIPRNVDKLETILHENISKLS
jgi:uracil-DNA glycosylase family 4